jgi:hypothetical protein
MIEKTKMKLEEAQFFYRRLNECRKQPLASEPNAFRFFLSAFMQAARIVPWRLQIEEKQKYDAWRPTWERQVTAEETYRRATAPNVELTVASLRHKQ